ncbi:MAG: hypothetical protein IPH20_15640 [Bacteroidales bacterium]|nr:hypothetical protein [Bacteroidales bacterium]
MKKLLTILLLVISAMELNATNDVVNYVTSGGKTYFCQKMKPGLLCANIRTCDGNILKFPFKNVDAYCCNGRLFERLPVVYEGAPANSTALMEYITTRNGLRLYRYCKYGECGDIYNSTYKKAHPQFIFFVFQDGKFYLEVNQKNAATVLPFFGIQTI